MAAATAWYVIPSQHPAARWFNILHWPYTLWHLSYVLLGAGLSGGDLNWPVLGWTILAFFLGMGVAAHCFDLMAGDPLRLGLQRAHLGLVGLLALMAAVGVGVWQVVAGNISVQLWPLIVIGILLAAGYNFEWPRWLHGDWQFAAWWAVFPLLVAYLAQEHSFTPALLPFIVFAFASAYAQRVLSTRARYLRRQVAHAHTFLTQQDNQVTQADKQWLLAPIELALVWLNAMMIALGVGLCLFR